MIWEDALKSDDSIEYHLDKLISIFKGQLREWSVFIDNFGFTKHFRVKNVQSVMQQIQGIGMIRPVELHFSLQCYSPPKLSPEPEGSRCDWNLVIDPDVEDMEERRVVTKRICSMLAKCGLYFLVDNRYHIWFPPWETIFIDDWNTLYGREDFAYGLKYYLEKMLELPDCIDDYNFKTGRKLFRVPFTLHLKSGKLMDFIVPNIDSVDTFTEYWSGSNQPTAVLEGYARNFQRFLSNAVRCGYQFYQMEQEELGNRKELFSAGGGYDWIEKQLLNIVIPKGKRDMVLYRILMPFFVNVKKYSKNETSMAVEAWLHRCNADKFKDNALFRFADREYVQFVNNGFLPPRLQRFINQYPHIAALMGKK